MGKPRTRYAKSGRINIAYQVFGQGDLDLVYIPGWISNVDTMWDDPDLAGLLASLGRFACVILFDKRGTGLSDRDVGFPTLDQRMDDLRAVMDAAGSERAALLGFSEGGNLAILFAASAPERVSHLVLFSCFARRLWAPDYPWAPTEKEREAWLTLNEAIWGERPDMERFAPSRVGDKAFTERLAAYFRHGASPGTVATLIRLNSQIDVRAILPTVSVPTLVLNRRGDVHVKAAEAEYLAAHIPGAKAVILPGRDHLVWSEDPAPILSEIEPFLTGTRRSDAAERVLATVLFTDIVESTSQAATLGDQAWRAKLAEHDAAVRAQLVSHRGRELNTTGDGFVAAFDAPARAIACALAIGRQIERHGLRVRAGVHTGECTLEGGELGGIALHIGARIAAKAGAGEVLVSQTVKDLVVGAGYGFSGRGGHQLKGVPGDWTLFAVSEG